jgi:hypothetical protein
MEGCAAEARGVSFSIAGQARPTRTKRTRREQSMSKRLQRWIDTWIEENILPGANTDIETNEARAERLTKQLLADAGAAGFQKFEIDGEIKRIPGRVKSAVADSTDFDVDAYHLKSQLAQENEDGD